MVIKITRALCLCVGQEQPRLPNVKVLKAVQYSTIYWQGCNNQRQFRYKAGLINRCSDVLVLQSIFYSKLLYKNYKNIKRQ